MAASAIFNGILVPKIKISLTIFWVFQHRGGNLFFLFELRVLLEE